MVVYIDIAAIDQSGLYRIDEGLRLHADRYGVPSHSSVPKQILRLLTNPGSLTPDRVFPHEQDDTLRYLRERVLEVEAELASSPTSEDIWTLPDEDTQHPLSGVQRRNRCRKWMPVARAYCCLTTGHSGHHRSK